MKTVLVIFVLNILIKERACDINPCPDKIQFFKSDEEGDYAIITIPSAVKSGLNSLKVDLELREDPTRGDNDLKFVKSKDEVVIDAKQGKNIEFKLNFLQSSLSPIVTKITLNNKNICSGVEDWYNFSIQDLYNAKPNYLTKVTGVDFTGRDWIGLA